VRFPQSPLPNFLASVPRKIHFEFRHLVQIDSSIRNAMNNPQAISAVFSKASTSTPSTNANNKPKDTQVRNQIDLADTLDIFPDDPYVPANSSISSRTGRKHKERHWPFQSRFSRRCIKYIYIGKDRHRANTIGPPLTDDGPYAECLDALENTCVYLHS